MKRLAPAPGSLRIGRSVRLLAAACWLSAVLLAAVPGSARADEGIVVVDVGYDLLMDLAEYQELMEAEQQRVEGVNGRLVPVIDRIIKGFNHERDNYLAVVRRAGKKPDQEKLSRIDAHIETFGTELLVREKAHEYEELRRMQRRMLLEKGL